jgi:hypothetical protein
MASAHFMIAQLITLPEILTILQRHPEPYYLDIGIDYHLIYTC